MTEARGVRDLFPLKQIIQGVVSVELQGDPLCERTMRWSVLYPQQQDSSHCQVFSMPSTYR